MGLQFGSLHEGMEFTTQWVVIPQGLISAFAELTGDRNSVHLDKDAAVQAGLPGTIAHGYLLVSLIPQLLDVEFSPVSHEMIINRALDWTFRNPVASGDSICLEVTVEKMSTRGNMTTITLKLLMKAQSNSKVVGQGSAVFYRIQHAQA